MPTIKCPGQDMRFWKPEDIFDAPCSQCGARMEFWKDDVRRQCKGCGAIVKNPRLDLGCAAWCKFAEQCLGIAPKGASGGEAGKLPEGASSPLPGARPAAAKKD